MSNWYSVENINEIDSPGLLIYPDRVKENIRIAKSFLDNPNRLRPHIKTNKSPEVTRMFVEAGITKFKCATIAEAEMLAMNGAKDVLLAHQPVGPKAGRLTELIKKYPSVKFSTIVDDAAVARTLKGIDLYIDLNVGMNRTGIEPEKALPLYNEFKSQIVGLHAYDGHLRDPDLSIRKKQSDEGFEKVLALQSRIANPKLTIVAGGTPSFSIHAKRKDVECSPGTFIYWDKGYQSVLTEQPFLIAALVVSRVVSIPTNDTICVDLGHKGIASENPIDKRVYFLNAEGLTPIGHSEEHLVLKTNGQQFKVGDVLYGVPHHICPTVNLYDSPNIIENGKYVGNWDTVSRKRKITV